MSNFPPVITDNHAKICFAKKLLKTAEEKAEKQGFYSFLGYTPIVLN